VSHVALAALLWGLSRGRGFPGGRLLGWGSPSGSFPPSPSYAAFSQGLRSPAQWGAVAYLVTLGTVVPFGLFLMGVRTLPARTATLVAMLEPFIPPHPGLRQDGGPGKAFPKPPDGAAHVKETPEKGIPSCATS